MRVVPGGYCAAALLPLRTGQSQSFCSRVRIWRQLYRAPPRTRSFSATWCSRDDKVPPASPRQSDIVRRVMRQVAHPVAIITASPKDDTGPSRDPRHWRGATVSSFVTVAMTPKPVVCFNIKRDSSTFAALTSSTQFNVHILGISDNAQIVATKFAGGNALEPFHDSNGDLEWWVKNPDSPHGDHPAIGIESNEHANADSTYELVLFRLVCRYLPEKTVDIGDHVVVFGEVRSTIEPSEGNDDQSSLLYLDGGYSVVYDH